MMALGLKMNSAMPFVKFQHEKVDEIRLRGSMTASQHVEVLLKLETGVLMRISRNNMEDTFQIGASEEGRSARPMPTIGQPMTPGDKPTLRRVLHIVGNVRQMWPRYDQADCQEFAKEILRRLSSAARLQALPFEDDDDDFM